MWTSIDWSVIKQGVLNWIKPNSQVQPILKSLIKSIVREIRLVKKTVCFKYLTSLHLGLGAQQIGETLHFGSVHFSREERPFGEFT